MKYFLVVIVFLLGGCASTLEDFEEMTAYQRIDFVCRNDRQNKNLNYQVKHFDTLIYEQSEIISRGYIIHTSCKDVPVTVSGNTSCYNYGYNISCSTSSYTKQKKVCEDVPVSISAELEKEKLELYREEHNRYNTQWRNRIKSCGNKVRKMNARQSFEYYQSVK